MALKVYKPGQGYWTRMVSVISFGALTLAGIHWLCQGQLKGVGGDNSLYIQSGVAVALIALGGWVLFHFIGAKPASCDFLIATEGEMKKVNWPNRREVIGSTWIVVCCLILLTTILFLSDAIVSDVAMRIDVIVGEPPSKLWAVARGLDGTPFFALLLASLVGGAIVPRLPMGSARRTVGLFFAFVTVHFIGTILYCSMTGRPIWGDVNFMVGTVFGLLLIALLPAMIGLITVVLAFGVSESGADTHRMAHPRT